MKRKGCNLTDYSTSYNIFEFVGTAIEIIIANEY